jgi:hypothetical protein
LVDVYTLPEKSLATQSATVAPDLARAAELRVNGAGGGASRERVLVQTTSAVPVQVRFSGDASWFSPVQFGIARLKTATPPPLGASLPAEIGTVVETGQLTYDAVTGAWNADANGSGWAQTPGEYLWQSSATLHIPPPPPVPDANGVITPSPCGGRPLTIVYDGRWVHRFTVLGASAVTAKAGKARNGRAKVDGTIAKNFPGRIRLTVACPGKRARTTLVETAHGRWSRRVHAKRGCRIAAAVAARQGWTASEASTRIN